MIWLYMIWIPYSPLLFVLYFCIVQSFFLENKRVLFDKDFEIWISIADMNEFNSNEFIFWQQNLQLHFTLKMTFFNFFYVSLLAILWHKISTILQVLFDFSHFALIVLVNLLILSWVRKLEFKKMFIECKTVKTKHCEV